MDFCFCITSDLEDLSRLSSSREDCKKIQTIENEIEKEFFLLIAIITGLLEIQLNMGRSILLLATGGLHLRKKSKRPQ